MAKVSVFTMGHTGVVLDAHTLEPGVPPDALAIAQNAVQDPKQGHGGAVTKRPGLARFNNAYAGGIILGGIPMPVAGTGGAPAAGGGALIGTGDVDDGTSVGTGDMTGSPGGTFDGGSVATTPAGAFQFNAGSAVFGGARLFVVGRLGTDVTTSNEGGSGWYVSSKGLANTATKQIPPGPPIAPYSYPAATPYLDAWGTPSCVFNSTLYYGSAYGNQVSGITVARTVGTGPRGVSIRSTNGANDNLVATVAVNSYGNLAGIDNPNHGIGSVTAFAGGAGYSVGNILTVVGGTGTAATLQVATIGGGGGVATASVLTAGSYTVLPGSPFTITGGGGAGATFTYGSTIGARAAAVFLHAGSNGLLYAGIKDKYSGQDTAKSMGRVIQIDPGTGGMVEMNLGQVGEGGYFGETSALVPMPFPHIPYCGCFFDGLLYVGTFPDAINDTAQLIATDGLFAPTGGASSVSFASTGHAFAFHSCMATYNGRLFLGTGVWETTPSFAGVWSRQPGTAGVGFSDWTQAFVTSGGVAQNGNYVVSMVTFGDSLYVSWFNPSAAAKIYKVTADTPGDPLSTSFTVSTVHSATQYPLYLFVDDGVMYAIGVNDATPSTAALVTTDGTTWTDKSTSLPTLASTSRMRPVFFGVNQ